MSRSRWNEEAVSHRPSAISADGGRLIAHSPTAVMGLAPNERSPGCDQREEPMIGTIGKKLGMTQVFNEQGQQIPVTVVEAPPNPVLKVMDKTPAGFAAVELGYGQQRSARASKKGEGTPRGRRATRAEIGHAKKAGLDYA